MKIEKLKSIDDASEKDLLKYIFATQLQILRRLDFLESKLDEKEDKKIRSHAETTKDMIDKIDSFTERINDYLSEE
jgi:ferritin-like metal-binding protein YciE